MEPFRIVGMLALIVLVCVGLGSAAFWVTSRSDEPVTIREVRMVVRALIVASVSGLLGMVIAPSRMFWLAGVLFVLFSVALITLLAFAHRKIMQVKKKESADE